MATVNDKIKKILAMIDGATTEGEARAASLALQRLLVANDMTLDEISLSDDAPEINETGEDVGKRVAIWVKALAYVIARNYRCESYFHVRHERDFWTNRQKITSKQVVFVGEAEDSVVAAGCFRATRHAIERCFTSYVERRFHETGVRIGKQSGSKNSYCLGFVERSLFLFHFRNLAIRNGAAGKLEMNVIVASFPAGSGKGSRLAL